MRLKHACRVIDTRAGDQRPPLLAVSIHHGVVPREVLTDGEPRADDLGTYRLCEPGDIVLNRMRAFQGAVGMTSQLGIVSPDYLVLRPRSLVCPQYLHYLFRSTSFVGAMITRLRGIGSTDTGTVRTPRINPEDLLNIRVDIPPLDEQRAISDFLDSETARIDALIRAKERSVQLAQERRRALRDAAFDARPGIRLKHLLKNSMAYGVLVPEFVEPGTGVPMIRTYNLTALGTIDHADIVEIPRELADQYRRTYVEAGDVVLSVVGSMGRAARVGTAEAGSNLNRPLARLRPRDELGTDLLWHWTQTSYFSDAAYLATGGGTAQPTLNLSDLANFPVGLPTDSGIWRSLCESLNTECERLNRLEDIARSQIRLLQERRQASITAAVTGQAHVPVSA